MNRITSGKYSHNKRIKIIKLTSGFTNSNSNLTVYAMEQLKQSGQYAYISRKLLKRNYKQACISILTKLFHLALSAYSKCIVVCNNSNIYLNKKLLIYSNITPPKKWVHQLNLFFDISNTYIYSF